MVLNTSPANAWLCLPLFGITVLTCFRRPTMFAPQVCVQSLNFRIVRLWSCWWRFEIRTPTRCPVSSRVVDCGSFVVWPAATIDLWLVSLFKRGMWAIASRENKTKHDLVHRILMQISIEFYRYLRFHIEFWFHSKFAKVCNIHLLRRLAPPKVAAAGVRKKWTVSSALEYQTRTPLNFKDVMLCVCV